MRFTITPHPILGFLLTKLLMTTRLELPFSNTIFLKRQSLTKIYGHWEFLSFLEDLGVLALSNPRRNYHHNSFNIFTKNHVNLPPDVHILITIHVHLTQPLFGNSQFKLSLSKSFCLRLVFIFIYWEARCSTELYIEVVGNWYYEVFDGVKVVLAVIVATKITKLQVKLSYPWRLY